MHARHTQEQEKYRSSRFYTNIFQLILTFVSYKHSIEAEDKEYTLDIDFELMKLM